MTVTSPAVKLVDVSLSVNESVAFSPLLRLALFVVTVTVGAIVSMAIGADRAAATLPLPAVSVNVLAATEIEPAAIELAVGVNVAV